MYKKMGCAFSIKIIQPEEKEAISSGKVIPLDDESVDSYMIDSPIFNYKKTETKD